MDSNEIIEETTKVLKIVKELKPMYSGERFSKMNIENEILQRCNGSGKILRLAMDIILKYRENNDLKI